jgi:molecular chaperone GrpE
MAEETKDVMEENKTQTQSEATQELEENEEPVTEETAGEEVPGTETAETEEGEGEVPSEEENDASPEEDSQSEETGENKKSGKGWGFGIGKNKKDDKKDQQIAELMDRVKRQMAEFDNFRKRSEKEKSTMFEMGARDVLEKMLPIMDNFERGLAAIPEAEKESATAVGMDKIYKQFLKAFEELDVKPIEAVGKEFSPDFHNAVMQAEEEGVGENIIVEEFQKGYLYRGTVIRHSMVKVNK